MNQTTPEFLTKYINSYANLGGIFEGVSIPYFNNNNSKKRAALRVFLGKASVEELREELELISLRKHLDYNKISTEEKKKFIVESNLGLDCSGLVFHILNHYLKFERKENIRKYLKFKNKNLIKFIFRIFRLVENTSVQVFFDSSKEVSLGEAKVLDLIIIKSTDTKKNHIMLITDIEREQGKIKTIKYIHSIRWNTSLRYEHGVDTGLINIIDLNKNLKEQVWLEKDKTGLENETLERALNSEVCGIFRII